MSLGIFRNGELIQTVAPDTSIRDHWRRGAELQERAYALMHELAARVGPAGIANGYEVLRPCPTHPERSVVDCTDCDPEES